MTSTPLSILTVVGLLFALCGATASRQAAAQGQTAATELQVGAGVLLRDTAYRGRDTEVLLAPFVRYQGERFSSSGLGLGWRAFGNARAGIDLRLQARMQGYHDDDAEILEGMASRQRSIDAGVSAYWTTRVGRFELGWLHDVMDRSGGQELSLDWSARIPVGSALLFPELGIRQQDASLVDYYFGVAPEEARDGRPAYAGRSAIIPSLGLAFTHPLRGRWSVLGRLSNEWLPAAITDSPLVERNRSTTLIIGVARQMGRD